MMTNENEEKNPSSYRRWLAVQLRLYDLGYGCTFKERHPRGHRNLKGCMAAQDWYTVSDPRDWFIVFRTTDIAEVERFADKVEEEVRATVSASARQEGEAASVAVS